VAEDNGIFSHQISDEQWNIFFSSIQYDNPEASVEKGSYCIRIIDGDHYLCTIEGMLEKLPSSNYESLKLTVG
jgi:hypothetical protein